MTFNPDTRTHWPVLEAYRDKKLSHAQAEAQLKDLGMVGWEIRLYLDDDQTCEEDEDE
jgi:hypothetical protein